MGQLLAAVAHISKNCLQQYWTESIFWHLKEKTVCILLFGTPWWLATPQKSGKFGVLEGCIQGHSWHQSEKKKEN